MKHYRDSNNSYIGAFDADPAGGFATPSAPETARDTWDGAQWVRNYTVADVVSEGARRLREIVVTYSSEERETWSEQTLEALSFQSDPTVSTPLLSSLAAGRGITVAEMAARVLTNRAALQVASGSVLMMQAKISATAPIPNPFLDATWVTT